MARPRVLEVRPRDADHHVLELLLQDRDLARLVEAGAPRAHHAHELDALAGELGQEELGAGRARDGGDDVGLGRLGPGDLRGQVGRGLRPGDDLDDLPGRGRRLVGGLEAPRLVLPEEVVGVHEDDALRGDARLLEDLVEVLDRPLAEERARGEVPVDVLDLLLSVLHGLRHVGRDGVGRGDVDEERDPALLGHGHDGRGVGRVEGAHEDLGPGVDEPFRLGPRHVLLGLGVAEQEL